MMPDVYLFRSCTNAVIVAPPPTFGPKLLTLNLRSVEVGHFELFTISVGNLRVRLDSQYVTDIN